MNKDLPANARGTGLMPGLGRFQMPGATKLVHNY